MADQVMSWGYGELVENYRELAAREARLRVQVMDAVDAKIESLTRAGKSEGDVYDLKVRLEKILADPAGQSVARCQCGHERLVHYTDDLPGCTKCGCEAFHALKGKSKS